MNILVVGATTLRMRRAGLVVFVALSLCATMLPFAQRQDAATTTGVVVQTTPGTAPQVAQALKTLGGQAVRALAAVDVVVARLPRARWQTVSQRADVVGLRPDQPVRLNQESSASDAASDGQSMYHLVQAIGAREYYDKGFTGAGIDIALIDSGIATVAGLDTANKVRYGPDLSFESQDERTRQRDTFGHGTHMAGIIAGQDRQVATPTAGDRQAFHGVAPGARLLSVRVADREGNTDVSQVIAAIDWVVQHRQDPGMRVRVLNLSFGTDSSQDYRVDPLAHAVEVAWRSGIVVVTSAGNQGSSAVGLDNPAMDPFVLAVGAQDTRGTQALSDDVVPPFSSAGNGVRDPDVIAPGVSVTSLRVAGSAVDVAYPSARVGERFFKGSGTSQAAAMVSGAVALILQQYPDLTPDEVKAFLRATAKPLNGTASRLQGAGALNLAGAISTKPVRGTRQGWQPSMGNGSLDAARGSVRLQQGGVVLDGERDIFGEAFDSAMHAKLAHNGMAWQDGIWNNGEWAGNGWQGTVWAPVQWARSSWSRSSWSSGGWARSSWSRSSWSVLEGWG